MVSPVTLGARQVAAPQDMEGQHGVEGAGARREAEGPGQLAPLPQHMQAIAPPHVAREEGQRHVAQPPAHELAGRVRPGGFMDSIRTWFRETRLGHTASAGLPDHVDVPMPGGGTVAFSGASLADMIRALPKAERAQARETLAATLGARLAHGQALLRDVLAGNAPERTAVQDVADLALFLDAKATATGNGFSEGAFSVEDPDGRLAAFLNRCPEKYQRSSSHMKADQQAMVDGHRNTHRGIDVPTGPNGLPHGRATTLFSVIPGGAGGVPARRLFLKMESHGCRLSTLGAREHAAGDDGVPDRPVRLRTDLGSAIGHAFSFLATRGQGSAAGSRKERIPDAVGNGYKALLRQAEGVLDPAGMDILRRNDPTGSSGGVRVMLANLRDAIAAMPHGAERNRFIQQSADLVRTMERTLAQADHPDSRIGNEVMFDVADLTGGAAPAAQLAPLDRTLFPAPLNAAQQAALARMTPAQRMHVLSVLPQASQALEGMLGLGIGGGPAARRGVDAAPRIMQQYDALARCIEGTSDSIDSASENFGRVVSFALLGMPDHQVADIHAQIASPEGERMRGLASAHTLAFTLGARETPASEVIGHLSKFGYLSATLVGALETRLDIPQAGRKPVMPDITPHMAAALQDVATTDGDAKLRVDAHGIAPMFRDDMARQASLSVGGVPLANPDAVVDAIPDPLLRAAVTRLAGQASIGALLEMGGSIMGSDRMFMVNAANGSGRMTFTFDPASGRFTGRQVEPLGILSAGGEVQALREGSTRTASFSCTLRVVDGGVQLGDVRADVDYDWDVAPRTE